jgi:hypothetical protein
VPKILFKNSIPILFEDGTSVVITNANIVDFQSNIKAVFKQLNEWFYLNLLSLNFDTTNFIHYKTKNTHNVDIVIQYGNRHISNIAYTKLVGITLDKYCVLENPYRSTST